MLVAEVVAHYYPRMVELHNYPPANSFAQKIYNWQTLTKKVFKKVGLAMAKPEMEALSNAEPGAVEQLLKKLQVAVRAPADQAGRARAHQSRGAAARPAHTLASPTRRCPRAFPRARVPSSALPARLSQLAKYNLRKKQQAAAGIDGSPGGHSPGQREGGGPQVPSERASAHALAAGADPLLVLQERDQTVDELVETISILEIKASARLRPLPRASLCAWAERRAEEAAVVPRRGGRRLCPTRRRRAALTRARPRPAPCCACARVSRR